jgi:hypothetical protein
VFEVLIGENPIELKHRKSKEIRENIEGNLLEEGIDCIKKGYIAGNWGMHQRALVTATIARQNASKEEILDWMFNNTGLGDFIYNTGVNLYENPRVKQLLDTPLDLICIGKFTPAIGDAGAIDSE